MGLVYFPASLYYLYLALKAKSLFFFSASNPGIETGGMFFESKWEIFKRIPPQYFPSTVLVNPLEPLDAIVDRMKISDIGFPIIVKPDRGERGWAVNIIEDASALKQYHQQTPITYLIQNLVSMPLEYSVFYYRKPGEKTGVITSVTRKEYLQVMGDGRSSVLQLIVKNDRALLQLKALKNNKGIDFNAILKRNEKLILLPFGNHVRGAMFLDETALSKTDLKYIFDAIALQIEGFYFGRFDLKCSSREDLIQGRNLQILELNGAGAEPSHIYQPGYSFFKAQQVIASHFKMMFEASMENKKRGFEFMTLDSFLKTKKEEKLYKSKVNL